MRDRSAVQQVKGVPTTEPRSASLKNNRGNREVQTLTVGEHVRWNSEAGRVSGVIIKKITADKKIMGYTHHASPQAPQYLIKSDKTDHIAIHKGSALRLIAPPTRKSNKAEGTNRKG